MCYLVAKVVTKLVRVKKALLLGPKQLGFGVRGGAETTVCAARRFLCKMAADCLVTEPDFQSVFNSIHLDKMLEATQDLALRHLFTPLTPRLCIPFGETGSSFLPRECIQQGDSLGHFLFCLIEPLWILSLFTV